MLGKKHYIAMSIIFTSVLFGLMHLIWKSAPELIFTTSAGVVFGIIYYKSKSIWPPVVAHIINNIFWLLFF